MVSVNWAVELIRSVVVEVVVSPAVSFVAFLPWLSVFGCFSVRLKLLLYLEGDIVVNLP